MFKGIFTGTTAALFVALFMTTAFAQSELDKEKAFTNFKGNPEQGAIVLRVDKNGNGAVLKLPAGINSDNEAMEVAKTGDFKDLPKDRLSDKKEIDRTSRGLDSWYFVCNVWCSYSWNNAWYNPVWYYSYPAWGYNYYYYAPVWNYGWYNNWYRRGWRRW